jgi:hypothetical protein
MNTKFWLEILKGRDHLEELGIDWIIISKWNFKEKILRMWTEINTDQDGVELWALMNMVTSLQVP